MYRIIVTRWSTVDLVGLKPDP